MLDYTGRQFVRLVVNYLCPAAKCYTAGGGVSLCLPGRKFLIAVIQILTLDERLMKISGVTGSIYTI